MKTCYKIMLWFFFVILVLSLISCAYVYGLEHGRHQGGILIMLNNDVYCNSTDGLSWLESGVCAEPGYNAKTSIECPFLNYGNNYLYVNATDYINDSLSMMEYIEFALITGCVPSIEPLI